MFWEWVASFAKELWPFRGVEAWQKGFYLVLNKPGREVGPGIYPVVPFFMEVRAVSVAPAIIRTSLLQVEMTDGTPLMFSASATVAVVDPKLAIISIDDYKQTSEELITALIAERLAETALDDISTARKRRNFLVRLQDELTQHLMLFGVECTALRFVNWARGVKTYRILNDPANALPGTTW